VLLHTIPDTKIGALKKVIGVNDGSEEKTKGREEVTPCLSFP